MADTSEAGIPGKAAAEDESKTLMKTKKKGSSFRKFLNVVKSRTKSGGKEDELEVAERAVSDSAAAGEPGGGESAEEKKQTGFKVPLEGMAKGGSSLAAALATPGRGEYSGGLEHVAGGRAAVTVADAAADAAAVKGKDSADAPPTPDILAEKAAGTLETGDSAEEMEPAEEQKQQEVQEAVGDASAMTTEIPTEEANAEQPKKEKRSPGRLRKGNIFTAVGIALGVIFIAMRLVAK